MQSKAESNNVEQVWGTEEQDPSLKRGRGRPGGRLKQNLWKTAQLQELTAFPRKAQSVHKANTPDKTLQGYITNCPPNLGKTISLFFTCGSAESVFPKLLVLVHYLYNFSIVLV